MTPPNPANRAPGLVESLVHAQGVLNSHGYSSDAETVHSAATALEEACRFAAHKPDCFSHVAQISDCDCGLLIFFARMGWVADEGGKHND